MKDKREYNTTGLYDIHGHYLPGVDDGAPDIETSLAMIGIAHQEGIRHIVMTPHCGGPRARSSGRVWQERFAETKGIFQERFPDMTFDLACELYYSSEALEALEMGEVLRYPGSSYVLTEFPESVRYPYMRQAIQMMRQNGVRPLIAHFERYGCLAGDIKKIDDLYNLGAKFQVNADTLTGGMGFFTKRFIMKCIKEQYVFVFGSDAHNLGSRTPQMQKCFQYLSTKLETEEIERMFIVNPQKLLGKK